MKLDEANTHIGERCCDCVILTVFKAKHNKHTMTWCECDCGVVFCWELSPLLQWKKRSCSACRFLSRK